MLASRFAAGDTPPQRSIIFAAFTGEEEGLLGSDHFVKHSPVPLKTIVAMLNMDMVGRIRTAAQIAASSTTTQSATASASASATQSSPGVLYVGGSGTAKVFERIVKEADEHSPLVVKDIGKGGIGPSDHMSFALKKIPVMFLFSGLHADYHRPTDDANKINYRGLEEVVDFAVDVIEQLAAMPRQQYVDAADASPMHVGMARGDGGGPRVTLGVVPDYSTFGQPGGVRISGAREGTPAAKAGLKGGDVIVQWNGKTLDTLQDLSDALGTAKPGQTVKLKVLRDESKEPIELEVTLAERKD
jgi:hypothetical protein